MSKMADFNFNLDQIVLTYARLVTDLKEWDRLIKEAKEKFAADHPEPKPVGKSDGPRCKSCGGRSWPAPSQYRGNYHEKGCQEAKYLEDAEKISRLRCARRNADQMIQSFKKVAFEGTEANAMFLLKGFRLELDDIINGQVHVIVCRNGCTIITVTGSIDDAIDWVNKKNDVYAAWQLGF